MGSIFRPSRERHTHHRTDFLLGVNRQVLPTVHNALALGPDRRAGGHDHQCELRAHQLVRAGDVPPQRKGPSTYSHAHL